VIQHQSWMEPRAPPKKAANFVHANGYFRVHRDYVSLAVIRWQRCYKRPGRMTYTIRDKGEGSDMEMGKWEGVTKR